MKTKQGIAKLQNLHYQQSPVITLLLLQVFIMSKLSSTSFAVLRALFYLVKYGYVDHHQNRTSSLLTEQGLTNYITSAVKDFQVGHPITAVYSQSKLLKHAEA